MPLTELQNGRYRLLRPLGSGSMGNVYLMEDTRINRQVAIKVIRGEDVGYADSNTLQDATRLFDREARAIARLNHPNILPLFDYGEEKTAEGVLTYMVMPYIPDGSLANWLKQRGENTILSTEETIHFLSQAADALQHAHDNDIIHQDVKPQNFLMRRNRNADLPDLLLADFGIAKLEAGTSGSSLSIRGTPLYMAPEQWEGHPVPATDQYALAVMIYQFLAGRTPFQGGPSQMMYQHISVSPMPPSTFNPALDTAVDAVLLQALAKKPENRFPSISAFAEALEQALTGTQVSNISGLNLNTENAVFVGEAQTPLAISRTEARNGTYRTLTLPGGRQLQAYIPAGTRDGQVIEVRDPNNPLGSNTPLLLAISVVPEFAGGQSMGGIGGNSQLTRTKNTPPFPYANNPIVLPGNAADRGSIAEGPTQMYTGGAANNYGNYTQQNDYAASSTSNPNNYQAGYVPPPVLPPQNDYQPNYAGGRPGYNEQRSGSTGRTIFLLFLVLLLLLASVGLFYYFAILGPSNNNQANATATATAQALANSNNATANANNTATAQSEATRIGQGNVNATATANAQASATANANGTATAIANGNANATATANAQATATANATATAGSQVPLKVTTIDITSNPTTITGIACGTTVPITYTVTFHAPANNVGGTVQFTYTANNGHSSASGTVTFAPGETTKTYNFQTTGVVNPSGSYPGIVTVTVSSPNSITSPPYQVPGTCS